MTKNNTVEELTVTYEEGGVVIIKEVDKSILSKGAWATIIFRFQEWDRNKKTYSPDKYTIRRYKKSGGEYRQQSKFTISSQEQAQKLITVLSAWIS